MPDSVKLILVLLILGLTAHLMAQDTPAGFETSGPAIGIFSGHLDVGAPSIAGDATYDTETGEYVVTGSGTNMWTDHDEFHFVWKRLSGDFILRADAELLGAGVDPHRKMGWIVRSGFEPDSAYVDIAVHGDGLTAIQFRRSAGGDGFSRSGAPDSLDRSRASTKASMGLD